MDFLRISDAKIKIVLSSAELGEYGISANDEGCSAANRRAVWEILEEAKARVGFDPEGDKILVQFYPTADRGCEIFVTKLGILNVSSARQVMRSDRVSLIAKAAVYCIFSSLSDVKRAVGAVLNKVGERRATLLCGEGTYILAVYEITDGKGLGELAPLFEFSTSITEDVFLYAAEHFDTLGSSVTLKELLNIT